MQQSGVVNLRVSTIEGRRVMRASQALILGQCQPMATPKQCSIITQRSNHGQSNMSAKEIWSPIKYSPPIASYIAASPSRSSALYSSTLASPFFGFEKSSMMRAPSLPIISLILALRKGSSGMSWLPPLKASAKYQQTIQLSVRILFPWTSIGTFPSDLGSLPVALLYSPRKKSPFSPKLTFLKVAGTSFYSATIRARCANGQNLLQTMVTSFSILINNMLKSYNHQTGNKHHFRTKRGEKTIRCNDLKMTEWHDHFLRLIIIKIKHAACQEHKGHSRQGQDRFRTDQQHHSQGRQDRARDLDLTTTEITSILQPQNQVNGGKNGAFDRFGEAKDYELYCFDGESNSKSVQAEFSIRSANKQEALQYSILGVIFIRFDSEDSHTRSLIYSLLPIAALLQIEWIGFFVLAGKSEEGQMVLARTASKVKS